MKQVKGGRLVSQGVFLVSVLSIGESHPEADEPTGVGGGSDGVGVGVACSAQKVPNAAPRGEIPESPQQMGPVPLLSPVHSTPPLGAGHIFSPRGRAGLCICWTLSFI